tara:strand:- start:1527 stop:1775 length:249 start_codon:yes stop_codon:yes gene_type:complete
MVYKTLKNFRYSYDLMQKYPRKHAPPFPPPVKLNKEVQKRSFPHNDKYTYSEKFVSVLNSSNLSKKILMIEEKSKSISEKDS